MVSTGTDYKLKSLDRNFLEILIPFTPNSDFTSSGLAIADLHLDSVRTNRKWVKNVFDQVVDRQGFIMIFGDLLDIMQAKGDPRGDKREVNPTYCVPGKCYFDLVVEDIVEFLLPYRTRLALISPGNHESNIEKRGEWDPITMIVRDLKRGGHCNVQRGGYAGNIRFSYINALKTAKNPRFGRRENYIDGAYHHGSGIGTEPKRVRFSQENPDCKFLIIGHHHQEMMKPLFQDRITNEGKRHRERVHFICLGSAKDDRQDSYDGYATEKFHALTMPSANWIESYWDRIRRLVDLEIKVAREI
jgi:hypothetical protein